MKMYSEQKEQRNELTIRKHADEESRPLAVHAIAYMSIQTCLIDINTVQPTRLVTTCMMMHYELVQKQGSLN